ncbi:hypothetical protein BDV98DRAFT_561307 [Pterulicium gracile]|uniref:Uncharacterized protein n=1 Tax=Pterulicium gracile TaxID=1884261 RepID=A0A5C3R2N5_9AGAR|nr:hypothetical protein BDV98DRAFT_561307 [Pterula gracilis]
MKLTFVALIAASIVGSNAFTVQTFTNARGCAGSPTNEYRFTNCNVCIQPPGTFQSVRFTDMDTNRRVTIHNQKNCTPGSQTGQGYGPSCWNQGATVLQSAFVSCDLSFAALTKAGNNTDVEVSSDEAVSIDLGSEA